MRNSLETQTDSDGRLSSVIRCHIPRPLRMSCRSLRYPYRWMLWARRSRVMGPNGGSGHPIRPGTGLRAPRYMPIRLIQIMAHPTRFRAGSLSNLLGSWWFGSYELSELALATAPPFSGITSPANPQAEAGYIIWLCARISRAVGRGSRAASNPPEKPRFGRPAPPGHPNLPHSKEVRRKTTHICCRPVNPLLKARFAKGLRRAPFACNYRFRA